MSPRARLAAHPLEDRAAPAVLAVGLADGTVEVHPDGRPDGTAVRWAPFPGLAGPVRVAVGDVTGDGTADVVAAAGPGGGPHVKVRDGATGAERLSAFAFDPGFTGGVTVAAADLTGDGVDEVVAGAGAGGGPRVVVLSGRDGAPLGSAFAFDPGFRGGVNVGAVDVDRDGAAEVVVGAGAGGGPHVVLLSGPNLSFLRSFFAFDPGSRSGVTVAGADLGRDGAPDLIVAAGPGGGPHVRVIDPADLAERGSFFAFDAGYAGGVSLAPADLDGDLLNDLLVGQAAGAGAIRGFGGDDFAPAADLGARAGGVALGGDLLGSDGGTGTEDLPPSADIPLLERLARYDRTSKTFVPVAAGSVAGPANLYVLAHGWAPGYRGWVDGYFAGTGKVLKWWQTDPKDPGYAEAAPYNTDGLGPAAAYLLNGMPPPENTFDITVSPDGIAKVITDADPAAVVLAYSWLDESATVGVISSLDALTGDVNLSEAHTTQNGLRLAAAVGQAVAPSFADTGRVHLLGHSHGSKVATVAAAELARLGTAAEQLTILDSPEDTLTQKFEAANFNWFFLRQLAVTRDPAAGGTFVDNYASYFGERYSNVAGAGLGNVVDVSLDPFVYTFLDPLKIGTNVSARHTYAAAWYAGTTAAPAGDGGLAFSPLLHPPPGVPRPALSDQDWGLLSLSDQYVLAEEVPFPPVATVTPVFTPVTFDSFASTGDVTTSGGGSSITLSDAGGTATWTGKFDPAVTGTGMTFGYQFAQLGAGDTLTVSVGGELLFVMEGTAAGTVARTATLSTGTLKPVYIWDYTLTLTLTSGGSAGDAAVTLGNFQQLTV